MSYNHEIIGRMFPTPLIYTRILTVEFSYIGTSYVNAYVLTIGGAIVKQELNITNEKGLYRIQFDLSHPVSGGNYILQLSNDSDMINQTFSID